MLCHEKRSESTSTYQFHLSCTPCCCLDMAVFWIPSWNQAMWAIYHQIVESQVHQCYPDVQKCPVSDLNFLERKWNQKRSQQISDIIWLSQTRYDQSTMLLILSCPSMLQCLAETLPSNSCQLGNNFSAVVSEKQMWLFGGTKFKYVGDETFSII